MEFGSSVTTIGGYVFWGTRRITRIISLSSNPPGANDDTFSGIDYLNCKLYVPVGARSAYKGSLGWIYFRSVYEFDDIDLIKCDVTGDDNVDISDVNAVINTMLGTEENSNILGYADVTGDGKVDIADVNAVINIMLGKR